MKTRIDTFMKDKITYTLKGIFFLFSILLLTSTSAFSQTETCRQIGEGTNENPDFPFSGALSRSYLQQIYNASELLAEDIEEGDNIRALAFNYFLETPTKRPIKIYLGNTSATALFNEWISINDLTLVYSSNCQEFSKGDNNWTKITLDTEFSYTGGNIVVAVLMNKEDATDTKNCYTNTNTDPRFYTHNGGLAISRYIKDGLDIPITFNEDGLPKTNEYLAGNSLQTRSNIRFCKTGELCPKVSKIKATNISDNSISLNWLNGGNETSWTIEYGPTGFNLGEGTSLETTSRSIEISNLSAVSTYDFYIRANCSENEKSKWQEPETFSTLCGIVNSNNYLEEFNNNDLSLECWTIIDEDENPDNDQYGKWTFSNNMAKYTYNKKNTPANDWLISPRLDVKQGMKFSFDYRRMSPTLKEKFSVHLITEDSPQDYQTAINVRPMEEVENTSFLKISPISLDDYVDQKVYIAIKCESDSEKSSLFIDNFRFYKPFSEKEITKFSFPEETETAIIDKENKRVTIEIGYSFSSSKLIPTIEISEYASITPPSGTEINFSSPVNYIVTAEDGSSQEWTVIVNKATNPSSKKNIISFSFPQQEEDEDVIIDTVNHIVEAKIHWIKSLKKITPNIEISKFATCEPAANSEQNFSSPVNYRITAEDGSYRDWTVKILRTESPIGAHCDNPVIIDLSTIGNSLTLDNETTKGFANLYNQTSLGLYDDGEDKVYKLSVSENSSYNIKIEANIANTSLTLFEGCPESNIIIKKSTATTQKEHSLNDLILHPNKEYFLMVDKRYTPKYINKYELTFTKNENPPCTSPNKLTVSNILQSTASISWEQALEETKWELKYGNKDFNIVTEGIIIEDILTPTHNLDALSQNTEYDIYIRSKCSETDISEWSESQTFKTLESCPSPNEISINSITANSALISWNGHNATNWIIEYKRSSETEFLSKEASSNSFLLEDLIHSSSYNIRIKAKCENNDESLYSTEETFFTACMNISELPYSERFEDYGTNKPQAFPICWQRPLTYNTSTEIFPSIVNNTGNTSEKCLKFKSETSSPTMASTQLINADFKDLSLEFELRSSGTISGSISIGLMSNPADTSTFTEVTTISHEIAQTKKHKIKFADYNIQGSNKAIAFKHTANSEFLYLFLSNVIVRENYSANDIISFSTPDLLSPVIISDNNITGTLSYDADISQQTPTIIVSEGATISPASGETLNFNNTLSFTVTAEDGTPQVWQVTLTKSPTPNTENDILSFSFPQLEGIAEIEASNSTVNAKINWLADLSNIEPIIEISKFASIFPESGLSQDFTDSPIKYTVRAQNGIPQEWNVSIIHADPPQGVSCENPYILMLSDLESPHIITGETTKGYDNTYQGVGMGNFDKGQDKIYKLSVNEKSIYNIKLSTPNTYVGMAIFEGCPSEENLIKKDQSHFTGGALFLNDIILKPNTDYYLMADKSSNPGYISSYDLTFTKNMNPPCISPNNLEVSEVSQTSAKFSWTQAFTENEWEIKYGDLGFYVNQTGTAINVSETAEYQVTVLTANKEYDIYIRSKCSEQENGSWYGPKKIKTLADCPSPTEINLSEISYNSVSINWNGHTASEWTLMYKKSSESEYQTIISQINSLSLTELSPSTTYQIKLKAKCGELYSEDSEEKIFTTNCLNITELPYSQNFETENLGEIPNCWYRPLEYTGLMPGTFPAVENNESFSLGKCLKFHSLANTPTIVATQLFDVNLEDLVLEFKLKREKERSGSIIIGVMSNPNDPETFVDVETLSPEHFTLAEYKIYFSASEISGPNKSIAFKHLSNGAYSYYWLDDLKVREKHSDKEILSFSTPDLIADASINGNNIIGAISQDADISHQIPTITISEGATILPASGEAQNFENTVIYTVTAEDNTSQEWYVKLNKEVSLSSEKEILAFSFTDSKGEAIINSLEKTVKAKAKWTANLASIVPEITISEYASIDPIITQAQDFTSPQTYIVRAQDSSTKEWTISITLEESPCLTAIVTPFTENFSTNSQSLDCWTIIDKNQDAKDTGNGKWTILTNEGYAEYKWSATENADDWLISPKLKLANNPNLSFKYRNSAASQKEKFSVYIVKQSPSNIENASIIQESITSENSNWQEINNISLLDYQGQEIYIAIKCESEKNKNFLHIKDFTVVSEGEVFKITSSADENGSINPVGKTFINKGEDIEFSISPNSNYKLDKLFDNSIDKIEDVEDNKYRLSNIQKDHNIIAQFILVNSISEESTLKINIYPNPTNDVLNIEVSDEISRIEIHTIEGKLIHKQNVNNDNCQYKTKSLSEGNYFLRIYTSDNKVNIKQFSIKR